MWAQRNDLVSFPPKSDSQTLRPFVINSSIVFPEWGGSQWNYLDTKENENSLLCVVPKWGTRHTQQRYWNVFSRDWRKFPFLLWELCNTGFSWAVPFFAGIGLFLRLRIRCGIHGQGCDWQVQCQSSNNGGWIVLVNTCRHQTALGRRDHGKIVLVPLLDPNLCELHGLLEFCVTVELSLEPGVGDGTRAPQVTAQTCGKGRIPWISSQDVPALMLHTQPA